MTLKNNRTPLLFYFKLCASFCSYQCFQTWVTVRKRPIWVKIDPCDLAIWRMTLTNNRAPFLCCLKLCSSSRNHWWIQTGVTVRKRPIWVKIIDFFSRVTLQFDVWPWNKIGHLFYATSSFVHHSVAIGDFKLEIQSRNAQFGSKSTIFFSHVTLQFDVWPWKTIGHLVYAASGFVHHLVTIGEFKLE